MEITLSKDQSMILLKDGFATQLKYQWPLMGMTHTVEESCHYPVILPLDTGEQIDMPDGFRMDRIAYVKSTGEPLPAGAYTLAIPFFQSAVSGFVIGAGGVITHYVKAE